MNRSALHIVIDVRQIAAPHFYVLQCIAAKIIYGK